jgi:glycerol-3-phosphate dehydrogenase (NAD(P)+)
MAKIGILGAGAWGIALGLVLHNNGHDVTLWTCVEKEAQMLRQEREHKTSLPGIQIPEDIHLTMELSAAVADMDLVVFAVASRFTRETAAKLKGLVLPHQKLLNVAKGIEEETLMTLSEIIEEELPGTDVSVLSGPSHAEEVGRGLPTTVVVASHTKETALYLQELFMNEVFRVYTSPDIKGVELGGALKNVIALAAGIADGAGCGDNTKAALITRGIAEISRLGTRMGGNIHTFHGLTGIGDLIVTCASMHSRNRRAGILIGQGKSMDEAMKEVNAVVEGVYSAKAAHKLAQKYQVSMPIVEQVNAVLFDEKEVKLALKDLMLREKRDEIIEGWN